jgi:hypothetical protein
MQSPGYHTFSQVGLSLGRGGGCGGGGCGNRRDRGKPDGGGAFKGILMMN